MIEKLRMKGFTVFREAEVEFVPGINVIIGENGMGKSHLLKLGYCLTWFTDHIANHLSDAGIGGQVLGKKLLGVFRPAHLGRLASRGPGRSRGEVEVTFRNNPAAGFAFSFATQSVLEVGFDAPPKRYVRAPSVFLPTKEVISMYPGFAALYRDYHLEIDETYYDLCLALERPLARGPREADIRQLLKPIEDVLCGRVVNWNGRFVLKLPKRGNMEMPLVAEGFRKLATIAYLIANGSLRNKAALFWDEPETNLNARYVRKVAATLVAIAKKGVQVIIATHSVFLMREIELLLSRRFNTRLSRRFIALGGEPGDVKLEQASDLEEIEPIVALDEEIDQSERYLAHEEGG